MVSIPLVELEKMFSDRLHLLLIKKKERKVFLVYFRWPRKVFELLKISSLPE